MACAEPDNQVNLSGFATADLFLRMRRSASTPNTAPFRLHYAQGGTASESGQISFSGGLALTGGARLFQHPLGGSFKPSTADVSDAPCLAFDTYLALDTGATETGAGEPLASLETLFLQLSQTGVTGLWIVKGFAAANAIPAVAEPARFPNDPCGRYVRIGRFTVPRGATFSGTVFASIVQVGDSSPTIVRVEVPNCATCWPAVPAAPAAP